MLRSLTLIVHTEFAAVVEPIIICDAPLLREASLTNFRGQVDLRLPWKQLKSLTFEGGDRGCGIDTVRRCTGLESLIFFPMGLGQMAQEPFVVNSLQTLMVSDTDIFSVLTAPRLECLSIWRIYSQRSIDAITSQVQPFISRSFCAIKKLSLRLLDNLTAPSLRVFLDLFDVVEDLKVRLPPSDVLAQFTGTLQDSGVLPRLKHLHLLDVRGSEDTYTLLLALLRSRHELAAGDALESFQLSAAAGPPSCIMVQFRALADSGMNVHVVDRSGGMLLDSDESR
jgi:hypothetical protein